VRGQMFSREILKFMRELDTPEIHGYKPEFGYRVYTRRPSRCPTRRRRCR
jgi:arginine decarboxylase